MKQKTNELALQKQISKIWFINFDP